MLRSHGACSGLLPVFARRALLCAALLALVSCRSPEITFAPTQVTLSISNNDPILLDRLTYLRVAVALRADDGWGPARPVMLSGADLRWPVDIPVTPRAPSDADKQFLVVVEALDDSGVLAETRAITRFWRDQQKLLKLQLSVCPGHELGYSCAEPGCKGDACRVCGPDGVCGPVPVIEPDDLPAVNPTQDAQVNDGSVLDAGDTQNVPGSDAGALSPGERDAESAGDSDASGLGPREAGPNPSDGGPSAADGGPEAGAALPEDPGKGPWERVAPDKCRLDATLLANADVVIGTYAIFRYGKLCHLKGSVGASQVYSATILLGGTMLGRAAYLLRDVPRSAPGTGSIKHEDKASDWLPSVTYNAQATLAHVMAMCAHNATLSYGSKTFGYDTVGTVQINSLIGVTERALTQLPAQGPTAVPFVQKEIFDRLGMSDSSWSGQYGIATGWIASLSDMGKLGTLLLHDGWYGGERLLSSQWTYRMSHPAFEDSNTAFGQLTWLNHRGNAVGTGSTAPDGTQGDPCAPAAFWPAYPHVPSGAADCRATSASCKQKHDVGVFSAQGLSGQFIVMHPGLDMVIVARDFSGGGPTALWKAIRPALVAKDPMFPGDETTFCAAYGAGDYAPDLIMPRRP